MPNKKLILSTGNLDKIEEVKWILKDLPIEVKSKNDYGLENFLVPEDGKTLRENAINKAVSIRGKVKGMVMADDTGLFVEYLNGEPGIYSARYSGPNASYEQNNMKLLDRLKGVPIDGRGASFVTVIALVAEEGTIMTVTGECRGYIGLEPKGQYGFGYDSIFVVEGYNKTFAELSDEIKNKISHRAKALEKLKTILMKI